MIVRVANLDAPPSDDVNQKYFRVLQSVCFSITVILNKYELITRSVGNIVEPYWSSVVYLAADSSTIMQRLQSILFLAVAYNSYGWLFTVLAPLALPSAISVTGWTVTTLCRLPISILKFSSKGLLWVGKFLVGYESTKEGYQPDPTSENTLIQVGWTKKTVGGIDKFIPHMVSKGDVQRLSHEMANRELIKPSFLSSIFDAHGVADLNMQARHNPDEWAIYLRETNPVGNFIQSIKQMFTELTTDENEDNGHVKTIEERLFTVVCKTLGNKHGNQGLNLFPLVEMFTESIFTKLYTSLDEKFQDTMLEALIIMMSSGYVDFTISKNVIQPSLSRNPSIESDVSNLTEDSLSLINLDKIGTNEPIILGLIVNTGETGSTRNSDVESSRSSESGSSANSEFGTPPLGSRTNSINSVSSTGSSINSTSFQTLLPFIPKPKSESCTIPESTLFLKDPSLLFEVRKQQIFHGLKEASKRVKQKEAFKRVKQIENEEKKAIAYLAKSNANMLERLDKMLETPKTNLSGFLLADAIGILMQKLTDFSILLIPLENKKIEGGYRRRRGPILATIGRKIVNNGIYRAIKPKLIASVYGKSKRRQRKRCTKKRYVKKGRRRITKKIYRKNRRSTHKKYKRR